MARLSEQLRYFVNKKISEDADWRGVEVVLSGHEVPGEGEHKIMEYIRLSKAQPGYNANVRHCLYGLDADLIMLGLLSHDPHFCLLREEVKFGPASKKKAGNTKSVLYFFLSYFCIVEASYRSVFNHKTFSSCIYVYYENIWISNSALSRLHCPSNTTSNGSSTTSY